ncbi:hypothetical protein [Paractinoplanes hotanensis]|uniref:Uncharacterized protein n=1 Tax=Paractinoplanes hotanensis TaxID=2906497 RepID=A0ABT0Y8H2_9ACTN|nr:hypothetical protein [Actinoplanes hotanensis]MCM4082333.1 hypothetical protein [Actinoplanes hotanensis]
MGQALERLREALATDDEPTLASVGGPAAILAAADDLPATDEFSYVMSLVIADWEHIRDRAALADLIVRAVEAAQPFELDDLLDQVLMNEAIVPDLAPKLEAPLKRRARGEDAAAGIALEAWLRLTLGAWTRPIPLLGMLDEHAATAADAEPDALDATFLQRLVRCLGAAGEHWSEHRTEMSAALTALLPHTSLDDNVAFELAMLQLHSGLEDAEPQRCITTLTEARSHFALCAQYEDRVDAKIFSTAIDALIAFVGGAVPTLVNLTSLKALVYEYRLGMLSEIPHWRQPRADTALQWLNLVDALARMQDLDRGWLHASELITDMAAIYRAHRTLTLVQSASVIGTEHLGVTESPALSALLQPRLVTAVTHNPHGTELLDQWLTTVERSFNNQQDIESIEELRVRVRAGGVPEHPKVVSADISALTDLLGIAVTDVHEIAPALSEFPSVTARLNTLAAAKVRASAVDVNIDFQKKFAQVKQDLLAASALSDEPAMRVEQVALALLRYARWRGSVTRGSNLAASFQREFTSRSDAPKESEFADDLHGFLAMNLPLVPEKEVSHIANGRIDLICHFGVISLVIECKRELDDASMDHLAELYAFQAAEYDWADPGVAFLVVLDLTKETRRTQLKDAVRVVTVPPVEAEGHPETVMVVKVQANLPSPSYQSTPQAARGRAATGLTASEYRNAT